MSPYISYGVECEDKSYFKTQNKEFISNSEMISQHNMISLLSELQTGEVRQSVV